MRRRITFQSRSRLPSWSATSTAVPAPYCTAISCSSGTKSIRSSASLWARTYSKLLVEVAWLLKVTHGLITSSRANPRYRMAAIRRGTSCSRSPEKDRATNPAPSEIAIWQRSMASKGLGSPFLEGLVRSLVAENWPLVRP